MRSRQATTRPHVSPKRRTSGVSSTQATKPLSSPVEESESVSSSESSNLRKPPFVSTKGGKLSLEAASVTEPGEAGPNGEADREKSSSVLTAEVAAPGGEKGEKTKDQLSVGAHDEGGSNEKIQRDGGKAEQAADRRTERESKPLSFCESLTSRLREKAERVLEKANAKWLEQEEHFEDLVKSRSLAAREELKVRETTLKALQGALNDKLEEQMRWRKKQLQRIRAYQERLREDAMRAGSGEKGLEDQSPETSADSSGGVKKKDKAGASREARTTLQALSSSAAASQSTKGVYRPAKTPTHAAGNASSSYGGAAPGASGSGACASPLSGKGGRSALPKGRRAGEEEKTSAASSSTSEEAERPADEERQCLADATAAQLFFLDDGEEEPGPEGENGDQETPRKKGKDGEEEERGGGRGQACATASRGERKKKEDFWTKEVVDANLKNAQQLLQEMRLVVTQLAADLEAIEASSAQKGGSEGRERKNAADAHIRTLCGALRDVAFHTRGDIERIVDEKCKIENLKLLHHQRAQTQIIQRLVVAIDAWTEQHATAYKKCEEELKIHNHHNAIREAVLTLRKGDDFTSPPEKQALERQMQEKEQSLSVKRHDVIHEALECLPASMTPEKVNRWMGRLGRIREVGEAWMRNLVGDFIDLKEIQRRRSEALIHTCSDRVEHFNARILWGACDTARAVAAQLLRPLQEQHLEELQMDLDVLASRMEERQRAEHHVCLRLLVFLSQVGSFLAAFRESHHLLNSSQRRLAMDASKAFVDANRQQAAGILALREEMKTAATLGELDALKKKAEEALRGLDGLVRAGVKRIGTLGQSFLPQTHERRRSELAKFLHLWNLAPLSEEQQKKYSALVEERGRTETNGSDGPSGSRLTDARDADGPSLPPPRALAEEKRRQESGDTEPSSHGRRAREREETHPEDASLSRGPSSPTARASPARMRSHANSGASKNLKGGEKRNENGSGRKPNSSSAHAGSSDRRPGTGGSSKEGETATGSKGSSHGGSKGDREDVRKKDKNGKRDVCDDEIDLDKDIWWTDSRGQTYRQLKTFEAMLGALVLPSSGDACALPVSPPAAPARDLPNDKKKMSSSPSSASLLLPRSLTALSASHRSVSNGRAASASRNAPLTEDGASGSPGSATQEEAEGRDEETGNPVEILLRESWKDGLTRLRAASFDFVARALDELETTATALGEAAYSTALGEMKRVLTEFDSTSATVASFSFVYKHRQQQLAAHVARLERFLQGVASAVGRQQHLLAQTEEELELLLQDMGAEQTQFQQLRLESLLTHVGGSATAVASSPSPVSPSKPLSSSVSARRASSSPGTRNGRLLFSSLSARGKEGKGDIEASPTALASGGDLEAGDGGSGDPPGASDDGLPDGRIGGCLIQQLERRRKQFVQEQDQLRKTAEAKIQFIEQSVIASLQKVHTKIQNFFSSTPPSISEKEIQEANSKRGEWTEEIEKRRDDWQARVASWKERLESTAAEGRKQMEEHFAGLEDRISRLYETVEAVARTSMLECLLGSVTSLPVSYAAAVEEIEKEFRCKAATAVVCASSTGGGASSVGRGNGRNDGLPTATGGGVPAGKDIESPVYVDHFAQYLRTQAEANRQKLVAVIRFFCRIVREELFPTAVCGIFLDLGRALQDQLEELCSAEENRCEQVTALVSKVCKEAASQLNASSAFITNGCIGHFEFLVTVLDRLPQLADFLPLDGWVRGKELFIVNLRLKFSSYRSLNGVFLESDGSNYFTKQWRGLPIQPWSLDATYGGIAAEANATEKWSAPVLPLLYPPKSATPVDNTPLSASSVNAREKAVTQQAHRHQPVGKPAAGGATAVRTDPLDDQNGSEILFSKTINSFSSPVHKQLFRVRNAAFLTALEEVRRASTETREQLASIYREVTQNRRLWTRKVEQLEQIRQEVLQ
ncbi:conserved hypothetical protein [Neospora caninum Liverpool]|uniref:PI-PLC Y-box domain-containing protein n=1 Tax=Neospora caninum (strain Liverpool) TaxID=572307 RepID=F0VIX8_NEOCL|nr:conserved hypothetical protein [Neospora caninum Liverpool]CBZ53689.1 conserved hypothetical protein [Neospora caninum Liverpool]|eukprot:XP_003883721.1 conserved hypothetical protein [Neospora caninum Liverpool]